MANTVLITGGTGFIGRHLALRFMTLGWHVHVSTRQKKAARQPAGAEIHACDTSDFKAAEQLLDSVRPDVVYHLAGCVTGETDIDLVLPTFHSHLTSGVNLLTLITRRLGARLVLAGSGLELHTGVPISPYAASKKAVSEYARMFRELYGTRVVVVRPFMTFGPGQERNKVLPYVISSLQSGQAPSLGAGKWQIDWVFISDVIDGMILAGIQAGIDGETLDFGRGEAVSLQTMVSRIVALMDSKIAPRFGAREDRPIEPELVANLAHVRRVLGWSPKVSLDDALKQTIDYYAKTMQTS